MKNKDFAKMSVRDAQVSFWAYGEALGDAGVGALECRSVIHTLMALGAAQGDGVKITNEELAREMGISTKTMTRWRRRLMDAQKRSGVHVVTYKPGRWANSGPVPSEYQIHWNVLREYMARRLEQKGYALVTS